MCVQPARRCARFSPKAKNPRASLAAPRSGEGAPPTVGLNTSGKSRQKWADLDASEKSRKNVIWRGERDGNAVQLGLARLGQSAFHSRTNFAKFSQILSSEACFVRSAALAVAPRCFAAPQALLAGFSPRRKTGATANSDGAGSRQARRKLRAIG